MLTHKSFIQNLVDLIIRRPLVTNDVVCNSLNKLIVHVVSSPFILQIWVSVSGHSLGVIQIHVNLIGSQHVKSNEVDYSFLPSVGSREVEVLNGLCVIVLDTV